VIEKRLKYSASIEMGQSPPSAEYSLSPETGFPFLQGTAEFGKEHPIPRVYCSSATKVSSAGDILFSVRAPVGELNIADQAYGIGRGLCAVRVKEGFHQRFAWWALHVVRERLNLESTGSTYDAVSAEDVANLRVPVPEITVQESTSSFLDRETSRIDALIAAKERLLELLAEKRRALITHAVTKGLNPNAPMRDSGLPWLGEIPRHWEVKKVWILFELGRGRVISHEEIADNIGEFPVYSSQTENDGVMGYLNTYDFEGSYLTWTTDGANAGTVFRREGKFNCTNVCGTLKAKDELTDLSFFQHALNISSSWFVRQDINPKLMNNVMARIPIQVPDPAEQRAIAEYINREAFRTDKLRAATMRTIDLLRERRSALIAAAVTGKIDVGSRQKVFESA